MFGLTEVYLTYPASPSSITTAIFQAKGSQASATEMEDSYQQEKEKKNQLHSTECMLVKLVKSLQVSGSH